MRLIPEPICVIVPAEIEILNAIAATLEDLKQISFDSAARADQLSGKLAVGYPWIQHSEHYVECGITQQNHRLH